MDKDKDKPRGRARESTPGTEPSESAEDDAERAHERPSGRDDSAQIEAMNAAKDAQDEVEARNKEEAKRATDPAHAQEKFAPARDDRGHPPELHGPPTPEPVDGDIHKAVEEFMLSIRPAHLRLLAVPPTDFSVSSNDLREQLIELLRRFRAGAPSGSRSRPA